MSIFCKPNDIVIDFNKYNNVKFKPSEIKNFYQYFKKITNNKNYINLEQFKKSLGILGYNRGNFICERLFDLIDKDRSKKV
jgi:Ca2+-binding EF-hand superfamily protein